MTVFFRPNESEADPRLQAKLAPRKIEVYHPVGARLRACTQVFEGNNKRRGLEKKSSRTGSMSRLYWSWGRGNIVADGGSKTKDESVIPRSAPKVLHVR